MKILLLENHEHFAKAVVKEFLSEHEVNVIPSIGAAKDEVGAGSFDVILSDYDLDDGKGDEFVTYAREMGISIPIVAISSHDLGNQAIIKAGATAVCSKMKFRDINLVLSKLVS